MFSGTESRFGEFGWLRSNCISPLPEARIVKTPSHGAIRSDEAKFLIVKNKFLDQKRCVGKVIDNLRLFYKADAAFAGEDRFVLDVDTKLGAVKRYEFVVDVTPDKAESPATKASFSGTVPEIRSTRDVFTGNEAQLAALNVVNTDCSAGPVPDMRIYEVTVR